MKLLNIFTPIKISKLVTKKNYTKSAFNKLIVFQNNLVT